MFQEAKKKNVRLKEIDDNYHHCFGDESNCDWALVNFEDNYNTVMTKYMCMFHRLQRSGEKQIVEQIADALYQGKLQKAWILSTKL